MTQPLVRNTTIQPILSVQKEKAAGKGEDAAVCCIGGKRGIIASLDGCGGAGARKYQKADGWTGARIASFTCARVLAEWYQQNRIDQLGLQGYPCEKIRDSLAEAFRQKLAERTAQTSDEAGGMISGGIVRSFPTTLAAILLSEGEAAIRSLFLWAGDSRCYLLTEKGLRQTTKDDLKRNVDPFDNLTKDAPMSNMIFAGDFRINCVEEWVKKPFVAITATDGCFGYFSTPMAFESMLLETLQKADSPAAWEKAIDEEIGAVAGDDYTLQAVAVGFEDFAGLKRFYVPALNRYRQLFGKRLEAAAGQDDLRDIWNDYQREYLRSTQA